MFEIRRDHPMDLKLINVAPTRGRSPVALAYTAKSKTLCVVNGGAYKVRGEDSVLCYSVTPEGLRVLPHTHTRLNLNIKHPSLGTIAHDLSDLQFTPDSKFLIVAAKSNQLTVIPVLLEGGEFKFGAPIRNRVGISPYSLSIVPHQNRNIVFYTDPFFGFGMFELGKGWIVVDSVGMFIPGQLNSCWSEISPSTGHVFSVDFAVNSSLTYAAIAEVKLRDQGSRLPSAEILRQYVLEGPLLDTRIRRTPAGDFLYVLKLTPDAFGVYVLSLGKAGKAKLLQTLLLPNVPLTKAMSGLAIYVSN